MRFTHENKGFRNRILRAGERGNKDRPDHGQSQADMARVAFLWGTMHYGGSNIVTTSPVPKTRGVL